VTPTHPMKPATDAVLLKVPQILNIQIPSLDAYLKETGLQNETASEGFAQQTLRPRCKRKAVD